MTGKRINLFDRRKGSDRRRVYELGYFMNGGSERRKNRERRFCGERRKDWVWVEGCCSIPLEYHGQTEFTKNGKLRLIHSS